MNIYLAGLVASCTELVTTNLIKNGFISYYSVFQKPKTAFNDLVLSRKHVESIIIDSGAHSFFSASDVRLGASAIKSKSKSNLDPQEYFEGYLSWLVDHQKYYDYFVELDIGELTGQKTVLEWRSRLDKMGLLDRCIIVYHPRVTTYEEYLRELNCPSGYIAIEGDRSSRKGLPYNQLIKPAYERGVRIHGFAMVKMKVMDQYPFYSVDSSSWKMPVMFGSLQYMTPDYKMSSISMKAGKMKPEDIMKLAELGIDANKLMAKKHSEFYFERLKVMIHYYNRLARYYTSYWAEKGINWEEKLCQKRK